MRIAGLLLLLLAIGTATAQAPVAPVQPQPAERLVDREFGIASSGYALRRDVQILRRVPGTQGDRLVWQDVEVPSTQLPDGRADPAPPLAAWVWLAPARMPDGDELPHALIVELGVWRLLHPDPALLPPNLAATFQRVGDVLTTAADPMAPQAGDLRLRWSELVLPDGTGFVATDDGWVAVVADAGHDAAVAADSAADARIQEPGPYWRYWLAAGLLLAIVALIAWRRQRRR